MSGEVTGEEAAKILDNLNASPAHRHSLEGAAGDQLCALGYLN